MEILFIFILYAFILSIALNLLGFRDNEKIKSGREAEFSQKSMRILVVGATGGTGRQLVQQALHRGHKVTALVRKPAKLLIDHNNLVIVKGNVLDPTSVDRAVAGQDAVISALGHKRYFYPTRILSDGTQNLIQSMRKQKVNRLICETSLGIGDSAGQMGIYYTFFTIPVILPFYFWDKTRQEQRISESLLDWVIVRPGVLTNGKKKGRYQTGHPAGSFVLTRRISRADVADFMLNQLTDDRFLRKAPGITR